MRKEVDSSKKDIESMRTFLVALLVFGFCVSSLSTSIAQTPVDPSRYAPCQTTLACSAGLGGMVEQRWEKRQLLWCSKLQLIA
jgi:hypothetical protein